LENCKPLLTVVPVNKGGITYQCPVPMTEQKREFKATKFILNSCLEKDKNLRFYKALANELIDANSNRVRFSLKFFKQFNFFYNFYF
jgi:small subunit ribosomal protein S7